MNSWFVSDIHLTGVHERNGNILLRFLFYLNQNPKEQRLFLLGDIFDVWVSNGRAFVNHYKLIIDEIVKLKKAGGEVFYFEGNHDIHVDVFWSKEFNIPVIENMQYFDLDGLIVRLEHGDFINPDDSAYLQYRDLVHHKWIEFLGHNLPSHFWKWLAGAQSKKSRKKTARYSIDNATEIVKLIRTYAQNKYREKPFDLIVTGHMHIFDDYQFQIQDTKVRSINLGTWLETPRVLKISSVHRTGEKRNNDKKIEVINLESFDLQT